MDNKVATKMPRVNIRAVTEVASIIDKASIQYAVRGIQIRDPELSIHILAWPH